MKSIVHVGPSMYPTLKNMDILQVTPYNGRKIQCGDVILFLPPEGDHKITHRVISIDSRGVITRGDNSNSIDPWILHPDDIIGRVTLAERKGKSLKVHGGAWGRLFARILRARRWIDLTISKILRPAYHRAAKLDLVRRVLPHLVKTRVIYFNRLNGMEMQLVVGKRVIGRHLPGKYQWKIRRPFRLFVSEETLRAVDPDHPIITDSCNEGMMKRFNQYEQNLSQGVRQIGARVAGKRAAKEILLLCSTVSISAGAREQLSQILAQPVDWKYLLDLGAFHGILPLVVHNLGVSGFFAQVPQPYIDRLRHVYQSTVYRNMILYNELADVLSIFNKHGIDAIPLKGTILSEVLYGSHTLRSFGDIDILVKLTDLCLARRLLAELGYKQIIRKQARKHPFHGAAYCRKARLPLNLELHWDLEDSRLASIPKQEIWHRAQMLRFQGATTLVLSPEDNLLFLANHLTKHNSNLLKLLIDVAQLLEKYKGSLDWDYITRSAHCWQIAPSVYYSLRRAKDLLGAPVPPVRLKALKPKAWRWWLMDFLISQETFVSSIKADRLRSHTSALVRSLMMKRPREMIYVLSRQYSSDQIGTWLRIVFWTLVVVVTAIGHHCTNFVARRGF